MNIFKDKLERLFRRLKPQIDEDKKKMIIENALKHHQVLPERSKNMSSILNNGFIKKGLVTISYVSGLLIIIAIGLMLFEKMNDSGDKLENDNNMVLMPEKEKSRNVIDGRMTRGSDTGREDAADGLKQSITGYFDKTETTKSSIATGKSLSSKTTGSRGLENTLTDVPEIVSEDKIISLSKVKKQESTEDTGIIDGEKSAEFHIKKLEGKDFSGEKERNESLNQKDKVSKGKEESKTDEKDSKKIIYNISALYRVKNAQTSSEMLISKAKELGGYSSYVRKNQISETSTQISLKLKVPSSVHEKFIFALRSIGDEISYYSTEQDITKTYYDIEQRIKNKTTLLERLRQLAKRRTDKVYDLLQVERELNRVTFELEQDKSSLLSYDEQVRYATFDITLQESGYQKKEAHVNTFWDRVGFLFEDLLETFKSVVVFLLHGISFILPILAVLLPLYFVVKHYLKKRKK